ncbi:hypothetical protein [Luteolibacter sp. Populi]|uniref:hypothetical protein n=1 Tax=Luteolibacter sp. Populi TaxID=3230487 RepID=UPI003466FB21
MAEEPDELLEAAGGTIPLGVRLTGHFLNLFVFVLTLPTAAAAFLCLAGLGAVAHEPRDALGAIARSAAILGVFCAMLAALLGASWLVLAVRAPHEDSGHARWPLHPLRAIAKPLVIAGRVYAVFASVAWLTVMILSSGTRSSWTWLCFWVALGIGSHLLVRMIDRYPGAR